VKEHVTEKDRKDFAKSLENESLKAEELTAKIDEFASMRARDIRDKKIEILQNRIKSEKKEVTTEEMKKNKAVEEEYSKIPVIQVWLNTLSKSEKADPPLKIYEDELKRFEKLRDDCGKKFRYGLLLEGEKTKDQKIDYLKERLENNQRKDLEDELRKVTTKGWWLDGLNEKVKGNKSDLELKKIYQDEIESIKKERLEPDAFANIDCEMIRKEVWVPKDDSLYDYAIYYTSELEKKKRFIHTIWPPHCLIGTEGHSVEDEIAKACDFWTKVTLRPVKYEYKGMNLLTENFSAIEAEVPINSDPTTQKNGELLKKLREKCKYLIVVGQARSHCVRYTVEHIVDDWLENVWKAPRDKEQVPKDQLPQIILPTDGSSCVAPPDAPKAFIGATEEFIKTMKSKTESKCVVDLDGKELKCSDVFNYIAKNKKNDVAHK